ncbi:MAG: hypothetical protein ACEPOW_00100 [Bacteroidales bacterium]
MEIKTNKILLKSLDKDLSTKEIAELEEAISKDKILASDQKKYLAIREALREKKYDFNPYFSSKVMSQIAANAVSNVSNFSLSVFQAFKRVAWTGTAAIVIIICVILLTEGLDFFELLRSNYANLDTLTASIYY